MGYSVSETILESFFGIFLPNEPLPSHSLEHSIGDEEKWIEQVVDETAHVPHDSAPERRKFFPEEIDFPRHLSLSIQSLCLIAGYLHCRLLVSGFSILNC